MAPLDERLEAKLRTLAADEPEQFELIIKLVKLGHAHLFEQWKTGNVSPTAIREFAAHLAEVDKACPAGLCQYIKNAQKLLKGTSILTTKLYMK